ncbi:MAG: hypothetical protein AABY22_25665 [Nanoarchaeota archaeon]
MKLLSNKYKGLKLKFFGLVIDSKYTGITWQAKLTDGRELLIDYYLGGLSIGEGVDHVECRNNMEEVFELNLDREEDLTEKELFRILKWEKVK